MAAVISDFGSDFGSDSSRSHYHRSVNMRTGSGEQRSSAESPYRQTARAGPPSPHSQPQTQPSAILTGTPPPSTPSRAIQHETGAEIVEGQPEASSEPPPSPPLSSSSNPGSYTRQRSTGHESLQQRSAVSGQSPSYSNPPSQHHSSSSPSPSAQPLPRAASSSDDVMGYSGSTIKVRDLAHIQSFALEQFSSRGEGGMRRAADNPNLKYEISGMPITDIIEMVAGLLTKITKTNDRQHDSLHRPLPTGEAAANISGQSSSVLAFHGKNVPQISILAYLGRIHKYCPTTYEVFLSLLVYFDRMTERVNATPQQSARETAEQGNSRASSTYSAEGSDLADSPSPSRSASDTEDDLQKAQYTHTGQPESASPFPLSHYFVVDSFNIHRLVISGVTCASKFFSDVFYTNSRYAKVCVPSPRYLKYDAYIYISRLADFPSQN